MKKTKAERKDRRKKIFGVLGKIVGVTAGVAIDVVPAGGRVANALPVLKEIPAVKEAAESDVVTDIVPLVRTIQKLKALLERLLDRLFGFR